MAEQRPTGSQRRTTTRLTSLLRGRARRSSGARPVLAAPTLLGEHDPQLPQCVHYGLRLQPPKAPHKPMLVDCSDLIQGDEAGPALKPTGRSPRVRLSARGHGSNDDRPLHTHQELPLPLLIVEGSGLRGIEKPVVSNRAHLPCRIGPTATSLVARFGSRHHEPAGLGSDPHLLSQIRRSQQTLRHSDSTVGPELHDAHRRGHVQECSPASSACYRMAAQRLPGHGYVQRRVGPITSATQLHDHRPRVRLPAETRGPVAKTGLVGLTHGGWSAVMHHGVGAAGQMAFLDARTKVSPQVVGHFDRGVGPRLTLPAPCSPSPGPRP